MKGFTMGQWINLNQNNRCVVVSQHLASQEKTGLILLSLVGLMAGCRQAGWQAGRQADEIWVDFEILKFSQIRFYLIKYQCNNTIIVLAKHFIQLSQVKPFKACSGMKILVAIFHVY